MLMQCREVPVLTSTPGRFWAEAVTSRQAELRDWDGVDDGRKPSRSVVLEGRTVPSLLGRQVHCSVRRNDVQLQPAVYRLPAKDLLLHRWSDLLSHASVPRIWMYLPSPLSTLQRYPGQSAHGIGNVRVGKARDCLGR